MQLVVFLFQTRGNLSTEKFSELDDLMRQTSVIGLGKYRLLSRIRRRQHWLQLYIKQQSWRVTAADAIIACLMRLEVYWKSLFKFLAIYINPRTTDRGKEKPIKIHLNSNMKNSEKKKLNFHSSAKTNESFIIRRNKKS